MNEFELIDHFFSHPLKQRKDVLLGIGDDAALLKPPANQSLVVAMDTLVAGVHFPEFTKPFDIGYKSLAVNLSDLAAMGATPAWATLALTLPKADKKWLTEFSKGFFKLLKEHDMQLVGGDTTRGPLTITVQVHGFVPEKLALCRNQAKAGDLIYVTGTLGDAGLALLMAIHHSKPVARMKHGEIREKNLILERLNCPTPRIEEGLALRKISNCAIDISDGLAADLKHILQKSHVGATICVEDLPLSNALKNRLSSPEAWNLALTAGDDYELCFTTPPANETKLKKVFEKINCPLTCIGQIEKKAGLRLTYRDGRTYNVKPKGYQHF